jgi:hypothetical protein
MRSVRDCRCQVSDGTALSQSGSKICQMFREDFICTLFSLRKPSYGTAGLPVQPCYR